MNYFFLPEAIDEFDSAVGYYEQCQPGLGLDFSSEVYAAIARVIEFPGACSMLSKDIRRCLINRFPFALIYRIRGDTLLIYAVANLHRRPGYWKARIRKFN